MKPFPILAILVLGFSLQNNSCHRAQDKWVNMRGPNDPTSIAFFFMKDATYEQKDTFQRTILHKPHPEGKGYDLQDGIAGLFSLRNSGYEGFGINFSTDATPEERERLKKNVQNSPIVYKVYENVVPSQIGNLQSNHEWVDMGGPTKNTSLLFFFKKDATREQIQAFHDNVLSKPSPYGPNAGRDLPDGVAADFRVLNCSYEGVGINFSSDSTPQQRVKLRNQIRESQIVFRVYENLVPSEIKDLCAQTISPNPVEKKPVEMSTPKE